jgi:hypothetical protein
MVFVPTSTLKPPGLTGDQSCRVIDSAKRDLEARLGMERRLNVIPAFG